MRTTGSSSWETTVFRVVFGTAVRRATRSALVGRLRDRGDVGAGRFTRAEVAEILELSWDRFGLLAPEVPTEPRIGNRMNMLLSCLTLACLQTMLSNGIDRQYAIELISDVAWKVYERWGRWVFVLASLRSRDTLQRLRLSVNTFLDFPFSPPGYLLDRVPNRNGISFDMVRCPVAEYFQRQGASDLCLGSWCNQDFALAELWGARLERTKTLAGGDECCDFRFHAEVSKPVDGPEARA